MNYYKQGDAAKAEEIKAAFEKLGYKELLLKDLCARLPYGVKTSYSGHEMTIRGVDVESKTVDVIDWGKARFAAVRIEKIKPYLRPMNSMTEEERNELRQLMNCDAVTDCSLEYAVGGCVDYDDFLVYYDDSSKLTDWLNKNMFDYRGLIEKGLALEAPESMYNS